jgi:CubicO group peptidase (beta-lactamase class C family)
LLTDYRKRIIADWGKSHEPKVPEGSPFQYANFGYVIVGAMIEKATGQRWEHLITRRIFEPLGLKTAGLGPQATFGRYVLASSCWRRLLRCLSSRQSLR